MPFRIGSFLGNSAKAAMPPLSDLKPTNVTDVGKTYHGLLSYAKNGQVLSQFYVDFKGPIMAGAVSGSLLILVLQVLMKKYGRQLVEEWLIAILPYITGGSFAIIGTGITYLRKGVAVWRIGTTIYNVGAGIVNLYHGGVNKAFVLVDIILVGEYIPSNTYLRYKGNATQDFLDLIEKGTGK